LNTGSTYLHAPISSTSASSSAIHQQRREPQPKRALMARSASHQKQKQQMSPDEWLKKLEADSANFRDNDGEDGELHPELKGGQRGKSGGNVGGRGQTGMIFILE
jgi:hypothetical protein